jgi:hypothetical protein
MEEHVFKRSFAPLLSRKDGSARLTYAGYLHDCSKEKRPFLKLIFSCRDVTHKNPANISILCPYRISANLTDPSKMNDITQSLLALGYQFPKDDFIELTDEDEFGHGIEEDEVGFTAEIYDFLKNMRGLVYKGQLGQDDKGFYEIKIESLKPLLGKDGEQLRDYAADDAVDADDIDIDFDDTTLN